MSLALAAISHIQIFHILDGCAIYDITNNYNNEEVVLLCINEIQTVGLHTLFCISPSPLLRKKIVSIIIDCNEFSSPLCAFANLVPFSFSASQK